MMRPGLVACSAAALLLSACGASRVVSDTPSSAYSPLEFSVAGSGRDLRTEVVGNPFGGDKASFDKSVTDLMQDQYFGPTTHFTTTPDDGANRLYKVVMVFNPTETLLGSEICAGRRIATDDRPGQPIRLRAAFCRGGALTSTSGYAPALTSPEDPTFRTLVADATFSLFPIRDPNHSDNCRMPNC
ncbi:hypothetical protein N825_05860 [Skermanella stibiiresistens SB22]|uniref:Lipoprotein n=1 Tax=Skermanella stibiiresistens SB22 TaxID=1385369 RepID=W9H0C7_9PROT|nr:hypothetical protein [Skermanella stibiiresistens]EWY39610.1 hypothetical protein N825_05860 [Skermanella stibiiresistens SB22]